MRTLVLLAILAACEPTWEVKNVATARPTTTPSTACIDAGLQATGLPYRPSSNVFKPVVGWDVTQYGSRTLVSWDPRHPELISFGVMGIGTEPPPGVVDGYRRIRNELVPKLAASCGAFDISAETCMRVACAPVPPAP